MLRSDLPKNPVKTASLNSETAEITFLPGMESQCTSTSDTADDLCQELVSAKYMIAKLFPKSSGKERDSVVSDIVFVKN